jgi:predicted transcriptional regulator
MTIEKELFRETHSLPRKRQARQAFVITDNYRNLNRLSWKCSRASPLRGAGLLSISTRFIPPRLGKTGVFPQSTVLAVDSYVKNRRITVIPLLAARGMALRPFPRTVGLSEKESFLSMPRPKHDQPTPGELEVLKILWRRGPSTVRDVMEVLNRRRERAYTSVMSLLNVMTDKKLVRREPQGRAFLYHAAVTKERTLGDVVKDVVGRVFEGSARDLVAHLLNQSECSTQELDEIRALIERHERDASEK